MKAIKLISLSETVIVPAKGMFKLENQYMHYMGKINGKNNAGKTSTTEVFIANCQAIEEIPGLVQKEISEAELLLEKAYTKEAIQSIENTIECYSSMMKNLNNNSLRHEIPKDLKEVIAFKLQSGKDFPHIFMSGVSSLVEE